MSKESLLKEGTIRRFMKLAGTDVLASDFLVEQAPGEEDPLADLGGEPGGELGAEPGGEEMDFADVEMEEPGAEEEGEEPEEEGDIEDAVRAMVDAIADVASDFGVDVEVGEEETAELEVPEFEGEEEEGEEEVGLGDEEEELGGEEEEEELALQEQAPTGAHKACLDKCAKKGQAEQSDCVDACKRAEQKRKYGATRSEKKGQFDEPAVKGSLDEIDYIDEDAVMQEVFHRVKNRLVQEKQTDDMASMLAEKIARRMNKRR